MNKLNSLKLVNNKLIHLALSLNELIGKYFLVSVIYFNFYESNKWSYKLDSSRNLCSKNVFTWVGLFKS